MRGTCARSNGAASLIASAISNGAEREPSTAEVDGGLAALAKFGARRNPVAARVPAGIRRSIRRTKRRGGGGASRASRALRGDGRRAHRRRRARGLPRRAETDETTRRRVRRRDDASDGENDDASDENAFRESVSATETNASSHSFDSLLPALDPETDERRGGRLATGALTLSFLVGAAEDVVATRGGCAAAVDAPVGSYYPVRAYDRVAQEMARCGLDGVSREWLARAQWGPAGGSHAALDPRQFQAAADACVSESGFKSGTYRDARRHAVRADGARLRSIAEHFRRAESALLECRGGRRAYSAARTIGRHTRRVQRRPGSRRVPLRRIPGGKRRRAEPRKRRRAEPAARRAREADSESESVSVDADESVSVDADESVSVDADESVSVDADSNGASSGLSAWGAMGVGALAGAVVVAVAWAVNRACGGGGGGGAEKADAHTPRERGRQRRRRRFGEFGGWFRSAILPPPRGWFRRGPSARRGSRSGFRSGFRSRRFAATVLDPRGSRPGRVALLQTRDSESAVTPSPSPRRQPDRPSRRASARARARAQSRSRAPNREGTDTRGGGVSRGHRCADRVAARWGESDSSGPSAPPGTGSGTSPRGGDDPRAF